MPRRPIWWVLRSYLGAAFALLATVGAARADAYYVVVFGAESRPQRPKFSHSFATFVHIPGGCPCGPPVPDAGLAEWFTISWLPCKIELTPNVPFSEPGRNFDLPSSMEIAYAHCEEVTAFGPYQIEKELYCRALQHKRLLESGDVRYKLIDTTFNPRRVSNCIHALTSFNREHARVRIGRTNFGDVASYYVAETYVPWMCCPNQVHCWVADLIGLGNYPIKWRTQEQGRPRARD
jgi:hypothetical protein